MRSCGGGRWKLEGYIEGWEMGKWENINKYFLFPFFTPLLILWTNQYKIVFKLLCLKWWRCWCVWQQRTRPCKITDFTDTNEWMLVARGITGFIFISPTFLCYRTFGNILSVREYTIFILGLNRPRIQPQPIIPPGPSYGRLFPWAKDMCTLNSFYRKFITSKTI